MSEKRLVVGAVIVDELDRPSRVLACRRAALRRWEFPGGKVEAGETPEAALVRELREELGVTATPADELPSPIGAWPIDDALEMRVWVATVAGDVVTDGTHDAWEWVEPARLRALDWLDADVAVALAAHDWVVNRATRPTPPRELDLGDGLRLRWLTRADAEALAPILGDATVVAALGHGVLTPAQTRLLIEARCRDAEAGRNAPYVVLLDGEVVGQAGLKLRPAGSIAGATGEWEGDFGFTLAPSTQGRGLGTRVAEALLRTGFAELGLRRITAEVFTNAPASLRVMEKMGMRREGLHVRGCVGHDGRWLDDVWWAQLREEWLARHGE